MKTYLIELFTLAFFLSGCVPAPFSVPVTTQAPIVTTPVFSTATVTVSTTTPTVTALTSTPALVTDSMPSGLVVAYIVEDALWAWKQSNSQLLTRQQNISAPLLSDDGQWIVFQQRNISSDGSISTEEVWAIRIDGKELHRLLGSDDLAALTGEEAILLIIDDIGWLPGRHELLFNTEKITEGPPGSLPLFDLYSLDLSGHVIRLADSGQGGRFVPSPNGLSVAIATPTRIGALDLESGKQRTLLEFEPFSLASDSGVPIPEVVWDHQSQFVMTSLLPQKLYYPEVYAGEPTQVWRLHVSGQTELITELQPFAPAPGIVFAPNLQYFLYLHNSCFDGMGMLHVYNLASGGDHPLYCVWKLPQWAPDSEHFVYWLENLWQSGNIFDTASQPLDFLNGPANPNMYSSRPLTWVNNEFFLLILRNQDHCTLNVATLQGIVAEIAHASAEACPEADFSLSEQ